MLTVTKSIKFDAAHILTNHQGLCKNLHGHTYRVEVGVTQPPDDTADMVIDFKDLKRVGEEVIVSRFDHAFIYDSTSQGESEIAAVVEKHGMRTAALPFRSTAENLPSFPDPMPKNSAIPSPSTLERRFGRKSARANSTVSFGAAIRSNTSPPHAWRSASASRWAPSHRRAGTLYRRC